MLHRLICALIVSVLALSLAILPVLAGGPVTDLRTAASESIDNRAALQAASQSSSPVSVIVQLSDPPVALQARTAPGQTLSMTDAVAQAADTRIARSQAAFVDLLSRAIPGARVTHRFRVVLNGLGLVVPGRDIPLLQRLPGVKAVTITRRFRPAMNVSLPLIRASLLWRDVRTNRAGAGILVGIIDTGIEITNPCFSGQGFRYPAGFPKTDNAGNAAYVNRKVIVARAYPEDTSQPDVAKDTNGHGSHVAGTTACNSGTAAVFQGVPFTISGVAPRAFLGNYNVFPNGAASTSDAQIVDAIEDAVLDGVKVVNMSIGGLILTPTDLDPAVIATNNAVDAGVVMAVAAGNSGPDEGTVSSPGNAEKAITAGASTNPHFVGQPVNVTGPSPVPGQLTNMGGAAGDFATYASTTQAQYVWWGSLGANDLACDPVGGKPLSGKIALIQRGTCPFTTKVRNAENAGAIGALIFNHSAGDPVAMGDDGTPPTPTIPALMVSKTNGGAMRDFVQGQPTATVRVDPQFVEVKTASADIIAPFSSRGPTTFDNHMKPDVTAPGVNILSAINSASGFAFFQGTSMASPHVAGSAALLRQKYPKWAPQQIKSALMSTGKRPVVDHVSGTSATGVVTRGAGRIDLGAARDPRATFDPASINFGTVAPGLTVTKTVNVTGVGNGTWTVSVSGPAASGVAVTATPGSVSLAAGSTTKLTVKAQIGAAVGQFEGDIVLAGTTTLRIPFWGAVGAP